jgi:hypothetical protein
MIVIYKQTLINNYEINTPCKVAQGWAVSQSALSSIAFGDVSSTTPSASGAGVHRGECGVWVQVQGQAEG